MSKIQWTNKTWNPIIGCKEISPGCRNCYAQRMAKRLAAMSIKHVRPELDGYAKVIQGGKWDGTTWFREDQLLKPLKWKKPKMIFICSMGDLFHESVPFKWIDKVFDIILLTIRHTYQILTKRPERMKEYFQHRYLNEKTKNICVLSNLWIGVTAENQEQANKRIPILLKIPAVKRFVSIEPMIGPIDLCEVSLHRLVKRDIDGGASYPLNWIICGCETGPKRREMNIGWVKKLKDHINGGAPFFFKQAYINGKKVSLPMLDGKIYDQMPI